MNVLFVTLFPLENNTSVTISNYGLLMGLHALGYEVTILDSLHRRQLHTLAKVTKGDERSQQYSQRQRLGHQGEGSEIEELHQHIHRDTLAHQLIHIQPKELHNEDKQADKEGSDKQDGETSQYEYVEFLDAQNNGSFNSRAKIRNLIENRGLQANNCYRPATRRSSSIWLSHIWVRSSSASLREISVISNT